MSLPEVLLWQRLRGAQTGMKFRRQHPIGPYVADFYCAAARLVIEVDGEIHAGRTGKDLNRDRFLRENGYEVLRLNAADVLKNVDAAAEAIASFAARPLHHPADDGQVELPPAIPAMSGGHGDLPIPPRAGEELQ